MKLFFNIFISLAIITSCNNNNYPVAENAFDAGREFIDGGLKGDFNKAKFYMLKDSVNIILLNKLEAAYNDNSAPVQEQYKNASIIINDEEAIDASTHIIYYKNSYDKIARKVKIVKVNGDWLVDFKYSLNGNL